MAYVKLKYSSNALNLHNLTETTPWQRSRLSYSHPVSSERRIKVIDTGKCSALKAQFMIKISRMHQGFLCFFLVSRFSFKLKSKQSRRIAFAVSHMSWYVYKLKCYSRFDLVLQSVRPIKLTEAVKYSVFKCFVIQIFIMCQVHGFK